MNRGKPQKFVALAQEILRRAQADGLHSGDRLPSERELAGTFRCNHLTVRKALKLLSAQGQLHTIPGRGSFLGPETAAGVKSDLIGFIFPDDEIFYYRIFADSDVHGNGIDPDISDLIKDIGEFKTTPFIEGVIKVIESYSKS